MKYRNEAIKLKESGYISGSFFYFKISIEIICNFMYTMSSTKKSDFIYFKIQNERTRAISSTRKL